MSKGLGDIIYTAVKKAFGDEEGYDDLKKPYGLGDTIYTATRKAINNEDYDGSDSKPVGLGDTIYAAVKKASDELGGIGGGGGITPSGTKRITANGTYDVTEYASANVSVQPSGIINITKNGRTTVGKYAVADVNVVPEFGTVTVTLETSGEAITAEDGLVMEWGDNTYAPTSYSPHIVFDNVVPSADIVSFECENMKYVVFGAFSSVQSPSIAGEGSSILQLTDGSITMSANVYM